MQPIHSSWSKMTLKDAPHPAPSAKIIIPSYTASLAPSNLARSPMVWSTQEVKAWLGFCVEEFALDPLCMDKFHMNGKALCLLLRNDFMERAPHAGDVLFNAFQQLKAQDTGFPNYSSVPVYGTTPASMTIVSPTYHISPTTAPEPSFKASVSSHSHPSFVPILPQPAKTNVNDVGHTNNGINTDFREDFSSVPESLLSPAPTEKYSSDSDSCHNDSGQSPHSLDQTMDRGHSPCSHTMDNIPSSENDLNFGLHPLSASEGECRLLWEFIYQLLQDESYSELVCWDREAEHQLTFRINKPMELADLWGKQKNRNNMTYEKLSRALRYYYKMNIIHKVQGKKLTYEFLQHPTKIRKGQRGARPHSQKLLVSSTLSSPMTSPHDAIQTRSKTPIFQGQGENFQSDDRSSPDSIQSHFVDESCLNTKDPYKDDTPKTSYNRDSPPCSDTVLNGVQTCVPHTSQLESETVPEMEQKPLEVSHKEFRSKSCDSVYSSPQLMVSIATKHHSKVDMDSAQWSRDRSPPRSPTDPPAAVEATYPPSYFSTLSTPQPPRSRAQPPRSRSPLQVQKSSPSCRAKYCQYSPGSSVRHSPLLQSGAVYGNGCILHPTLENRVLPLQAHSSSSSSTSMFCPPNPPHGSATDQGKRSYPEITQEYYFSDSVRSKGSHIRDGFEEQEIPEDLSIKKGPPKTERAP